MHHPAMLILSGSGLYQKGVRLLVSVSSLPKQDGPRIGCYSAPRNGAGRLRSRCRRSPWLSGEYPAILRGSAAWDGVATAKPYQRY